MDIKSRYSDQELERRRKHSCALLFSDWYQEQMDTDYWSNGQRCSGCDYWQSSEGKVGECSAAGILSGAERVKLIGINFISYTPEPGFPYTRHNFWCGKFKDGFDWSSLDDDYLHKIGAMQAGVLMPLPVPGNQPPETD